ncbi:hypothetical protein Anas_06383 [Armadillidium nasatum]|uniref:Uncharacterized protein n=1 Tax=Armadillidium nasatum TaxID=96803 RepID=A0A5N5TJR7_9CRUS|nr:hypothetical protein Anas_06383 [Armadillidium nasatum]
MKFILLSFLETIMPDRDRDRDRDRNHNRNSKFPIIAIYGRINARRKANERIAWVFGFPFYKR